MLVVQEDDGEPEHRELRVEVEAAAERQPPELPVAECREQRRGLELVVLVVLPLAEHQSADERADRAQRREEEECRLRPSGRGDRRQRQRTDEPADRDRRLADAERKAALALRRTSA